MPARRKVVAGAIMLAYPFAVHTAIIFDQIVIASIALFLISTAGATFTFLRIREHRGVFLLIFGSLAILSLLNLVSNTRHALYIAPVMINLAMLAVFAGTLLPGREPLISTFHRLTVSRDMDQVISAYTRRLTWVWATLFAAMTVESAVLAIFAPLAIWSLFANFLNYFFVAALLIGEYFYRIIRFRHYPHPSLLQFLRHLVQIDWIRVSRSW